MARYTITEPHPTIRQNTYTHAGRGGAGNHFRAPATTPSTGIPTTLTPVTSNTSTASSSSSSSARAFYSGRGGAGNAHHQIERPVLSFEDEFSRADTRDRTDAGHYVGRGGAGNFTRTKTDKGDGRKGSRVSSALSSSNASTASTASTRPSKLLGRLSAPFRH